MARLVPAAARGVGRVHPGQPEVTRLVADREAADPYVRAAEPLQGADVALPAADQFRADGVVPALDLDVLVHHGGAVRAPPGLQRPGGEVQGTPLERAGRLTVAGRGVGGHGCGEVAYGGPGVERLGRGRGRAAQGFRGGPAGGDQVGLRGPQRGREQGGEMLDGDPHPVLRGVGRDPVAVQGLGQLDDERRGHVGQAGPSGQLRGFGG